MTTYELLESAVILYHMQGNVLIFPMYKNFEVSELVLVTPGMWIYDTFTDKDRKSVV